MKSRGITKKEVIDFNKSLSLMLLSKLSIVQALEILSLQTKNEKFKAIIKKILSDIKSGHSLSKSFSKYPQLFSDIYIANLKVAEETGQIAEVLSEYTGYLEKMEELKRKIIQAARYPVLVLTVAGGVVLFMVFFLIPTFQSLFSNAKITLPPITQAIMAISYGIKNNLYLLVFIAITISFIAAKAIKLESVRLFIDKGLISIPLVSKLYNKNLIARFSLSMALLLRNKVTLLDAIKISKNISPNRIFKSEIDQIIKRLIKGETFTANISKSKFFDLTFSRLLSVGEESAELEKVFYLISDYYGKEFDYYLDNVTALIEPFLILFVGLIVAVILVAMYLPMFELVNNFGV